MEDVKQQFIEAMGKVVELGKKLVEGPPSFKRGEDEDFSLEGPYDNATVCYDDVRDVGIRPDDSDQTIWLTAAGARDLWKWLGDNGYGVKQ